MSHLSALLEQSKKPTKSVSVQLPTEEVNGIDEVLARAEVRRSDFIAAAIRDAVSDLKQRLNNVPNTEG